MAGRRLARAATNPDGQPRPTRNEARVANLRASARHDYAGAQDEPERFMAAERYLLAAAAALRRRDPTTADEMTREMTNEVLRAATAMTALLSELGPRTDQTSNQTSNRRRTG